MIDTHRPLVLTFNTYTSLVLEDQTENGGYVDQLRSFIHSCMYVDEFHLFFRDSHLRAPFAVLLSVAFLFRPPLRSELLQERAFSLFSFHV